MENFEIASQTTWVLCALNVIFLGLYWFLTDTTNPRLKEKVNAPLSGRNSLYLIVAMILLSLMISRSLDEKFHDLNKKLDSIIEEK